MGMMGHLWVSDLRGGVTLGAFVLPHVPWMAHRSDDRPGVALAKGSTQIIVTLMVWGTLVGVGDTARRSGGRGHCCEGGDTARVGDTDGRSLR